MARPERHGRKFGQRRGPALGAGSGRLSSRKTLTSGGPRFGSGSTHSQLKEHVQAFLMAYNFAKWLKTLRGPTPYEHICKV